MQDTSFVNILENLNAEEGQQASNDSTRALPRPRIAPRRDPSAGDSRRPASLPEDPSEVVLEAQATATHDPVNHPVHYVSHPSGVECIIITEWMNFNLGNAVKYIWRSNDKGATIQDLEKARWYLDREINRLGRIVNT